MQKNKLIYITLILAAGSIAFGWNRLAGSCPQMVPEIKMQGGFFYEDMIMKKCEKDLKPRIYEKMRQKKKLLSETNREDRDIIHQKEDGIQVMDEAAVGDKGFQAELSWQDEPLTAFTPTDETVWAAASVNVRQRPDKDSKRKGILNTGEQVRRTGIGDNGWSRVIYMEEECYIYSSFLSTEEVAAYAADQIPEPEDKAEIPDSSGIISAEGRVDGSFVSLCETCLNKLPQNARTFLQNNGVHIYITDTNLADRFFAGQYNSVMGCTVYAEKAIYLEGRNGAVEVSAIHETGHMIDYLLGWASSTDEFNEIYLLEKDSFVEVGKRDSHNTSSAIEYFAEVLNQSILYPDSCSLYSPRSYEYVMNKINGL